MYTGWGTAGNCGTGTAVSGAGWGTGRGRRLTTTRTATTTAPHTGTADAPSRCHDRATQPDFTPVWGRGLVPPPVTGSVGVAFRPRVLPPLWQLESGSVEARAGRTFSM